MRVLVNYVDFHADNYQGGSGTSFEFETTLEIKEPCDDIWEEIHRQMVLIVAKQRPFKIKQDSDFPTIQKVTLL